MSRYNQILQRGTNHRGSTLQADINNIDSGGGGVDAYTKTQSDARYPLKTTLVNDYYTSLATDTLLLNYQLQADLATDVEAINLAYDSIIGKSDGALTMRRYIDFSENATISLYHAGTTGGGPPVQFISYFSDVQIYLDRPVFVDAANKIGYSGIVSSDYTSYTTSQLMPRSAVEDAISILGGGGSVTQLVDLTSSLTIDGTAKTLVYTVDATPIMQLNDLFGTFDIPLNLNQEILFNLGFDSPSLVWSLGSSTQNYIVDIASGAFKSGYSNLTASYAADQIVPKSIIETLISELGGGGSGSPFSVPVAYVNGIDQNLIGASNDNIPNIQWVVDNTITGNPELLSRDVTGSDYQWRINSNGTVEFLRTDIPSTYALFSSTGHTFYESLSFSGGGIQNAAIMTLANPNSDIATYSNFDCVSKEAIVNAITANSGAVAQIQSVTDSNNNMAITGDNLTPNSSNLNLQLYSDANVGYQSVLNVSEIPVAGGTDKHVIQLQNDALIQYSNGLDSLGITEPNVLTDKGYVDAKITPIAKNLQVTNGAANYQQNTVTHNLGLELSDLQLEFYLIITSATNGYSVGDILSGGDGLNYVGSTAGEGFGFGYRGNDTNSIIIKTVNAGWGIFPHKTNSAQLTLEYSQADLFVNIMGLSNGLTTTIQQQMSTEDFQIVQSNGQLTMSRTGFSDVNNSIIQLAYNSGGTIHQPINDMRINTDICQFYGQTLGNSKIHCEVVDPAFLLNYNQFWYNTSEQVIASVSSTSIEAVSFVTITPSSQQYKNSVKWCSHYGTDYGPFPDQVWFKYKKDFALENGLDSIPKMGWLYEDIESWDPQNKFGLYGYNTVINRETKTREQGTIKKIDEQKCLKFQLACQSKQISDLQTNLKRLETKMSTILQNLEASHDDSRRQTEKAQLKRMNQTFDQSDTASLKSVVVPSSKKINITRGQIIKK